MDIEKVFLHEFQSKRWFTNEIHSLLKQNGKVQEGALTPFALYDQYRTNIMTWLSNNNW